MRLTESGTAIGPHHVVEGDDSQQSLSISSVYHGQEWPLADQAERSIQRVAILARGTQSLIDSQG